MLLNRQDKIDIRCRAQQHPCVKAWLKDEKLTSIIKQPPDIDGSFALFFLKLLAGLQQTLVSQTQRGLGLWNRRHNMRSKKGFDIKKSSCLPLCQVDVWMIPLIMSGLLWLLVVFEGQESESESLARLTETTTSLLPGGFSWDESRSSAGTNRGMDTVNAVGQVESRHTETGVPCPWM